MGLPLFWAISITLEVSAEDHCDSTHSYEIYYFFKFQVVTDTP